MKRARIGLVAGLLLTVLVWTAWALSTVLVGTAWAAFTFAGHVEYTVGNSPLNAIAVGDFNGDGVLDVVVANNGGGTVSVLIGSGTGTYAVAVNYVLPASQPYQVSVGDLNGDGILDLFVCDFQATAWVLLGVGNGTFGAATTYATDTGPFGGALGDLNGDGKLDIVTCNHGAGTISVLLQTTSGTRSENSGVGGKLLPLFQNLTAVRGETRNGSTVKGE